MRDPALITSYRARWVFPVDRPPLAYGVVSVAGDKIVAVGPQPPEGTAIDLGNVALLPAFINAHTHLEFSLFERPFGQPGQSFSAWLKEVVTWRREQPAVQGQASLALDQGLKECAAAGTAVAGEIATPLFTEVWNWNLRHEPHLVFLELLSLNPDRVSPLLAAADDFTRESFATRRRGLSPHAPYTVHPDLLERAVQLSAERKFPVAMHIAESREELELLTNHTGPLVDLLKSLAAWYPDSLPRGRRTLDYLKTLSKAHRAIAAHGNFLLPDEIAFAAEQFERLSIAYCPRTHAHFDHGTYPLPQMLRAGVRVAVGTDSRASNPDLSIWNELKFIHEQHSSVSPMDILRMGTLAGAEALGVDREYGSLTPGKVAALALVELPVESSDPFESVLSGTQRMGPLLR